MGWDLRGTADQWVTSRKPTLGTRRYDSVSNVSGAISLLLLLVSCSGKCLPSGIAGTYELTSKGTVYTLQFGSGGQGTLSFAGRPIGALRWAVIEGPQQQMLELTASGEVFNSLQQLSSTVNAKHSASIAGGGVIESVPECNRAGVLQKLVIRYEDGLKFTRTDMAP
jgi:hypothetical protein